MRPLKLDLRKRFREWGKKEQAQWSTAISSVGGPSPEDGSAKAGSLPREILKTRYLSVKRWGYVLKVALLGQKLTWLVRGTVRQPARPLTRPVVDANKAAAEIGSDVATLLTAWDKASSRSVQRA